LIEPGDVNSKGKMEKVEMMERLT
jgi:hypothetical protein